MEDTLPRETAAEVTGLFNLMRTIGSSIDISIVATVLTRRTQHHWEVIGGHINRFNLDL